MNAEPHFTSIMSIENLSKTPRILTTTALHVVRSLAHITVLKTTWLRPTCEFVHRTARMSATMEPAMEAEVKII